MRPAGPPVDPRGPDRRQSLVDRVLQGGDRLAEDTERPRQQREPGTGKCVLAVRAGDDVLPGGLRPESSPYLSTRPIRCSRRLGDHGSRACTTASASCRLSPSSALPSATRIPPCSRHRTTAASRGGGILPGRVLGDHGSTGILRRRQPARPAASAPGPQNTTMRPCFLNTGSSTSTRALTCSPSPGLVGEEVEHLGFCRIEPAGRAGGSTPPWSVQRESRPLLSPSSRQRSASARSWETPSARDASTARTWPYAAD